MELLQDDSVRGPVAAALRRWWLCLLLCAAGLAAGLYVARIHHTQYTAESRLVVGSQNLSSYQVAGYALASQELAANYARYVDNGSLATSDVVKGMDASEQHSLISLTASPIAQSNVVVVEVVATNHHAAVEAAGNIADNLVTLTKNTGPSTSDLLDRYTQLSKKAARAQDDVDDARRHLAHAKDTGPGKKSAADKRKVDSAQRDVDRTVVVLESLNLQKTVAGAGYQQGLLQGTTDSQLSVIEPAGVTGNDAKHTKEIYGVAGIAAGVVVALVLSTGLERWAYRRRRRKRVPEHSMVTSFDPNGRLSETASV